MHVFIHMHFIINGIVEVNIKFTYMEQRSEEFVIIIKTKQYFE